MRSCATYDAGVLTVLAGATCDSIRITVSIPAFGLSGSATVPLVSFVSLQLTMNPFPTFSGSTSFSMSTLRLIDCTDVRQLAIARVVGTLSDGATTVLTTAGATTVAIDAAQSSATASLQDLGPQNVMRAETAGTVVLLATFNSVEEASFTVTVSDEVTQVTELTLSMPRSAPATT